jgi:hypothetical protein
MVARRFPEVSWTLTAPPYPSAMKIRLSGVTAMLSGPEGVGKVPMADLEFVSIIVTFASQRLET